MHKLYSMSSGMGFHTLTAKNRKSKPCHIQPRCAVDPHLKIFKGIAFLFGPMQLDVLNTAYTLFSFRYSICAGFIYCKQLFSQFFCAEVCARSCGGTAARSLVFSWLFEFVNHQDLLVS